MLVDKSFERRKQARVWVGSAAFSPQPQPFENFSGAASAGDCKAGSLALWRGGSKDE